MSEPPGGPESPGRQQPPPGGPESPGRQQSPPGGPESPGREQPPPGGPEPPGRQQERRAHPRPPERFRATARIEVSSDRGVFMISVAAELAGMHPQTLRMYESRGLIEPKRSPKGTRLYSHSDVERLKRIQEMTADLGLNLAGVERVFELEDMLEGMARKVQALERRAGELKAEVERLETLRRELRAEIVPYTRGGALIRVSDLL